jgi:4-amino-4-deoxy-L-arabinose transferase-like glycosyltransferase
MKLVRIQPKKESLILGAFVLLGVVFVSQNIGLLDFWLDEAAVYIAIKHSFRELGGVTAQYAQQFLHNFALKTWTVFFGNSVVVLRSFSAFCYLLLILMMYRVGTYLFRSKKVGLLAAFLATTSYFAIWYAMEVKTYALSALVGLSAFYFFLKSARESGGKNYFLYFVFSALGFYAHPWLGIIFGSQIISLLVFRKYAQKIPRLLLVQFLISLTAIPFFLLTLNQGRLGVNSYVGTVSFEVVAQSFTYLTYGASWAYLGFTLIALFFVIRKRFFLEVFFEQLFFGKNTKNGYFKKEALTTEQKEELAMNGILILYLFLPLFLAATISHFTPAYALGRYEMTVLPAFLLIMANLWCKIEEKFWLFAIGIILLYVAFSNSLRYRQNIEAYRSTTKTVVRDIYAQAKNDDYVITTDLSWATVYYYSSLLGSGKNINLVAYPKQIEKQVVWQNSEEMNRPENRDTYAKEVDVLVEEIKSNQRVDQIFVFYKADRPINEILKNKLDENFSVVENFYPAVPREPDWYDYVIIYKKKPKV